MDTVANWILVALWSMSCCYYISQAPLELPVQDLVLMIPQWCEMTDLVGTGCWQLSPEHTLVYCAATVVFLVVCWFKTQELIMDQTKIEAFNLECEVIAKEAEEDIERDVLWESAKSLMDQVDLEFTHCSALIASNNESLGKPVGGEAEWASGETDDDGDDEDATRKITGAHLRKGLKEAEDKQTLKNLLFVNDNEVKIRDETDLLKEPNFKPIN